ncbi:Snf1-related protein kinase regulatory subunit beta-2 [Thalictrum thalictroides]|uniref:Snf1-related protein kinase regulatory subunit beta-2 n=1 Tax=Thalictrum thalictroides TaxID=46969 RepID=A0A7J6W4P4_THATH|nr:Snf1-related protein kinase regulatory subunit beta-2 [Thalictrum thalictroides]
MEFVDDAEAVFNGILVKDMTAIAEIGEDFTIMKVLPSGVYQYRFIVDGQWRYVPDLPWAHDDVGNADAVAAMCLRDELELRPKMSNVVEALLPLLDQNPPSPAPETCADVRRLSCCRADLSSYVTSEQRNASQIVKLASGLTDLISAADLMFGRCQSLISDFLEPPMVPCTEPDAFSWYDEQLEMTSTISQHGFCFYANESAARGSYDSECSSSKDVPGL